MCFLEKYFQAALPFFSHNIKQLSLCSIVIDEGQCRLIALSRLKAPCVHQWLVEEEVSRELY